MKKKEFVLYSIMFIPVIILSYIQQRDLVEGVLASRWLLLVVACVWGAAVMSSLFKYMLIQNGVIDPEVIQIDGFWERVWKGFKSDVKEEYDEIFGNTEQKD